jgi:hypothetical protein
MELALAVGISSCVMKALVSSQPYLCLSQCLKPKLHHGALVGCILVWPLHTEAVLQGGKCASAHTS